MKYINYYLLGLNIITLLLFGVDKLKAKKNYYRIPERVLIIFCFAGGGVGGFLGMYLFNHKVRKWYFNLLVPVSIGLTIWSYYKIYLAK